MPFVDRAAELAWLHEGWDKGHCQFRILYGRRRVGKSRLLDEFKSGKRHITYQAVEGTVADHLRDLTVSILACEDDPVLRAAPLGSWDAALAYVSRLARSGPLVFIFDEYQYAAQADSTLASRLQRWISREVADLPLCLILCGSYIRFFIENVLTGPLYGRNNGVWQLAPLGYPEVGEFFPNWSPEDRIRAYAVTGGVPHYLVQFDPARGLAWNIAHNVLRRGAALYEDAELVMREELRDPRVYFSILRAIDDGCTTNYEIEQRVHGPNSRTHLTAYLETLTGLGFVERRRPVVGGVRRSLWTITDPYLRFWFKFVLPHRAILDRSPHPKHVYDTIVAPYFDEFVSKPCFEDVCREWVRRQIESGNLPLANAVGAWWGPVVTPRPENPRYREEREVDFVAAQRDRIVLVGEAKWTSSAVGFATLNHLRSVLHHVPGSDAATQTILFGRRFDERLSIAAQTEGVRLVEPAELFT